MLTYLSLHKHATMIHNNIATQTQASAIPIHSPGKKDADYPKSLNAKYLLGCTLRKCCGLLT